MSEELIISKLTRDSKYIASFEKASKMAMASDLNLDRNHLYHAKHHTYIATVDGELVGAVTLGPKHPKSKNGRLYLCSVYVFPDYRRRRVGTSLFIYASNKVKDYGCNALYYDSDPDSPESVSFCNAMAEMSRKAGISVTKV